MSPPPPPPRVRLRVWAGVYSTTLYTEKAQAWVEKTVGGADKAANSFVYLAYQAMHGPIEAPQQYVNNGHCSKVTTLNQRNIYCGMMACLDEGIGNLTETYKKLSIWEDTLVVLAADNGGHVGSSGNNVRPRFTSPFPCALLPSCRALGLRLTPLVVRCAAGLHCRLHSAERNPQTLRGACAAWASSTGLASRQSSVAL